MSKLSPRQLREKRKQRIAARRKKAKAKKGVRADGLPFVAEEGEGEDDDDMPDWLENKIEDGDDEDGDEGEGAMMPPADLPEEPEMPADDLEGQDDMPPMDDEDEDEDLLEEVPEEMPEELASIQAAFGYNPVYQKPSKLGPGGSSGFHYYGPPPDAGTSYGYFVDAANKVGIISPIPKKGAKVYSPVSGKPMKFTGRVGADALATVLAVADQMTELPVGEETRMTSAPIDKVVDPKAFDALTGEEISDVIPQGESRADEHEDLPPMDDEDAPPLPPEDEEGLDDEDMPMDEDEEALEGVEYEALQNIDDIDSESIAEDDVHMTLFDEGTPEAPGENPYWNIDLNGNPTARIYLKDQPKPAEIRKVFCSSDYYKGVSGAISKVGLKPVLKQLKAHIFANAVNKTALAKKIQARVDAEAQERVNATTKNLVSSLLRCSAIVCAGMDKNCYREIGNPLKEAIWAELHRHGVPNPAPIIEAAFRKGATPYFETVLAKAVEYMGMEPVALEQIENAIGEMDVIPPGDAVVGDDIPDVSLNPDEAATLSDRLAASSVAVAGISAIVGNPFGEHKEKLRSELRLGGAGPQQRR